MTAIHICGNSWPVKYHINCQGEPPPLHIGRTSAASMRSRPLAPPNLHAAGATGDYPKLNSSLSGIEGRTTRDNIDAVSLIVAIFPDLFGRRHFDQGQHSLQLIRMSGTGG